MTLFSLDAKEAVEHQLALLEAAKEAGVKRFAPSEWGSRVSFSSLVSLLELGRGRIGVDVRFVWFLRDRIIVGWRCICRRYQSGRP